MDEDIKLPEPVAWIAEYGGDIYTADQLRAAVEADRAARVVLSDDHIEDLCMELFVTAQGNSPMSEKLARIDEIVRRCLPGQPAQPLADEQILDGLSTINVTVWGQRSEDFEAGVRFAERMHGIGKP